MRFFKSDRLLANSVTRDTLCRCADPGAAMQQDTETVQRLTELRVEHRDLDVLIAQLQLTVTLDELALKRMKKRKLKLKDMIAMLESRLIPDMDA